jgi:hypothetical protein
MSVLVTHRDPFAIMPHVYHVELKTSLEDMVAQITTLPEGWPRHDEDVITVNGHVVPRGAWRMVQPKAFSPAGVRNEVMFHAPPMGGGGGGGGKDVLSTVASLGLIAITGGIASGAILGGFTGAAAAGGATVASNLLAGGVALAGSAAFASLSQSPTLPGGFGGGAVQESKTASAQVNVYDKNTSMTRIAGTRKVFPEGMTRPLGFYHGEDEVIEVVLGLAGPHKLEDIRADGALLEDMEGVEVETREGWPGEDPLTLITRYGRSEEIRSELRGHVVREDAPTVLDAPSDEITTALPQSKILTTANSQDEFWIDVSFPQGLSIDASSSTKLRVPFRLDIREKGADTWHNLPDLQFEAVKLREKRASIRLKWSDVDIAQATVASTGWVEARIVTPAQTVAPIGSDREAHAAFNRGAGVDYVVSSDSTGSAVKNVIASQSEVAIYLNTATFPRGQYEVRLRRGYAFEADSYDASSGELSSEVRDFFGYEGETTPSIEQTKQGLADTCVVMRHSSVVNEQPVRKGGVSIIAIRARNTSISKISTLASGYVRDWDGSAWTEWKTTSDPAPHLRDILGGMLNPKPVPASIIDNDELVAWSNAGHSCNAILRNTSVAEAARIVCGSGYAKLAASELWGVARDFDTSADTPVQVFSDTNMRGFYWSKAFKELPEGLRISFADKDDDYAIKQIIHPKGAADTQQISYEGLVTEAEVRARADYDLATQRRRSTFYSWMAPAEAIVCRKGSLVGVQAGMLSRNVGSGRIISIEFDGSGDVTAIMLDNAIPVMSEPGFDEIDDMSTVEDVSLIGRRSGALIRVSEDSSMSVHKLSTESSGARLVFETPFDPGEMQDGDLVIVGPYQEKVLRLKVLEMRPMPDFEYEITAVDEAPELFA